MAHPPAGSSLLFGALADSGRIKERKNGSYRMVLKGVDEIDWFTDRPYRSEGLWKPQKLIRQWDSFFETSDPNAQASFKVGEERELITFEMFKPKFNNKKQRLSFKIDAGIINNRESDLVTGLKGKALNEVTLFIDDALEDDWLTSCDITGADLTAANLTGAKADLVGATLVDVNLTGADLAGANLAGADLVGADLVGANLKGANLKGANLNSANLTGATLIGTTMSGATLTSTNLLGAFLGDVNLAGVNLGGAYLKGADLAKADLTNANLTEADLTGANLAGADLKGAIWENTTCTDGTMNSTSSPFTAPCTAEQLNLA